VQEMNHSTYPRYEGVTPVKDRSITTVFVRWQDEQRCKVPSRNARQGEQLESGKKVVLH
jgi:hypothetical protein